MKIGWMMMALMSKVVENDKAVEIRNQKVEKIADQRRDARDQSYDLKIHSGEKSWKMKKAVEIQDERRDAGSNNAAMSSFATENRR